MKSATSLYALALCLALSACGGGGGGGGGSSGGGSGGGGGGSGNTAPSFTSSGSASFTENGTGTAYTAVATDAAGTTLTYSLGGTDAALFAINASTGAVTFVAAPNFESPRDSNRDNVYDLTVSVSDGSLSASRSVAVTVTNVAGRISTRRVATGLSSPLYLLGRGDNSGRVLVVQKGGLVRVVDPRTGTIEATPFLDVSTMISTNSERGLLGLALAPNFSTTGVFYAFMTATNGDVQVRKFTATASGVAAGTAGDLILSVPHPDSNHNGGWMGFDPSGNLVIAMGDGGNGSAANGQNKNVLLGKMLRIDPSTDTFPSDPARDYAIPAGNPFATSGGAPEIWHWGLRNPFRNSFDRETGNFYIADVGQGAREEINLVRPTDPGLNFGWSILEGTLTYGGGSTTGLTAPVAQYSRGFAAFQGNSVTGGYVYRGGVVGLRGQYVFGDFISARLWSVPATSLAFGTTLSMSGAPFVERTSDFAPATGTINNISSFGEDDFANLYVVDYDGDIFMVDEVDE